MPKMEKGRPPENKRSRKPAHPVKREVNQEMKSFAESTMNELLGWYGYEKVELQDQESSDIRSYSGKTRRHQVSVLKENSDPKPSATETKMSPGSSVPAKNGVRETSCFPLSPSSSSSSPHVKDLHGTPVVVPLIKPSTVDEQQNVPIVCVWCQKEGLKRYSLLMGSELKSFCSEKCFAMCRRACFKRNKARDRDRHGELSPPPSGQTEEASPRLVLKMNSNTRVCDWCKHVRHTKYLDLGSGEERLQFCSTKCLNQYKMDIFYREARAALTATSASGSSPSCPDKESHPVMAPAENQTLLTPESWDNSQDGESKAPSPKTPTPVSSSVSVSSSSSSSSVRVSVSSQPQKERESLGLLQLKRAGTPTTSAPAPPLPVDQPRVLHNSPPFFRPPLHTQGSHSPVRHSNCNPASSPTRRPAHPSQHLQTPIVRPLHPPQLLHPYPASILPCTPTFPNPIPSFVPSLGLPCPQPTLLVPYPIIVPLPVPVPIPLPIPFDPALFCRARVIQNTDRKVESVTDAALRPLNRVNEVEMSNEEISGHKVKTEQALSSPEYSQRLSTQQDLDSTPPQPTAPVAVQRGDGGERQVIQRVFHRPLVKQETGIQVGPEVIEHGDSKRASSWAALNNEDDLDECKSTKNSVATLSIPLMQTSCPSASTPAHTLATDTSPILQKRSNPDSNNTTSVVTSTASALCGKSDTVSNVVPALYPSICFPNDTQASPDKPDQSCEPKTTSAHILAPPSDPEDVKENFSTEQDPGLNCSHQDHADCQNEPSDNSRGGTSEGDTPTTDEEHTYARCVPPKLREKTAHVMALAAAHTHTVMHTWDKSSHTHAHVVERSAGHTDTEPALKRRCLRIRDQNK